MKPWLIFAALAVGLVLFGIFVSNPLAALAGPIFGWIFVSEMRKAHKL